MQRVSLPVRRMLEPRDIDKVAADRSGQMANAIVTMRSTQSVYRSGRCEYLEWNRMAESAGRAFDLHLNVEAEPCALYRPACLEAE